VLPGKPEISSAVERQTMAVDTSAGVRSGYIARICEATPETCGQAIDVPEMVLICESERTHAAVIWEPGAWMSTHGPWFEKLLLASLLVVAPTVSAKGAEAGEKLQASASEFPAATTVSTPWSAAQAMMESKRPPPPPPNDMEMTAGFPRARASATAHSMPSMIPLVAPLPPHESTCTAMTVTPLDTP